MEYRIPQYVTVVQREAAPRRNVQRAVVHAGVTEIADDAFRDWTNLVEVVFEPGSRLRRVGDHSFAGTSLREFAAPEALREIGSGAFANCSYLRTVSLNKGLESLGEGAFQGSGLETIYDSSTLRALPEMVSAGCMRLRGMCLGEGCGVDVPGHARQSSAVGTADPESQTTGKHDAPAQRKTKDEETPEAEWEDKGEQITRLLERLQIAVRRKGAPGQ